MPDPLDYITTAEWKTLAAWQSGDTSVDTELPTLITEASDALNEWLEVKVTPKEDGPTARIFQVRGPLVDLDPFVLRAATLVELNPEASTPTTLTSNSDYATVTGPTYLKDGVITHVRLSQWLSLQSTFWFNFGYAQLRVTGSWGFATVPHSLKRACAKTVDAWLRSKRNAPYYGEDPREQQPQVVAVGELPYAAQNLARPWKRHPGSF